MSGDQNFWSRRRAGVQAEAEADVAAKDANALAQEQAALAEKSDAEILLQLNLPDPDTLKAGDNFSAFMAKAVPEHLRRRALRTLWRSNPVLANVDMLVDYGEDFTDSAMAVENMQTTYQIGKGMLKHVQEMARQAEELENPTAPDPIEEIADDEVILAAVEPEPEVEAEAVDAPQSDDEAEDVTYTTPAPRRMTFRIEGDAA